MNTQSVPQAHPYYPPSHTIVQPQPQPANYHYDSLGYRPYVHQHSTQFQSTASQPSNHRTQVAPAVPSFGNPLPVKPPASLPEAKKPKKKKKRRVNQLGLTPKADEHVSSSEEEEDVDEELKFASAASAGAQLEITYRGNTSVLQSPSDIAAWIEERKKKFPTAARKAENQARLRKLKEERDAKWREQKAQQAIERQQKALEHAETAKQDAAAKSKSKIEKLRQRLLKEERRIAKAEAKSLKRSASLDPDGDHRLETKRIKSESGEVTESRVPYLGNNESATLIKEEETTNGFQGQEPGPLSVTVSIPAENQATLEKLQEAEPPISIPDPLTPTSQPPVQEKEIKQESEAEFEFSIAGSNSESLPKPTAAHNLNVLQTNDAQVTTAIDTSSSTTLSGTSVSSSDLSDSNDDDSDDTSSSGSSSSSSDSDNEAPKAVTSRRKRPQKVPPPRKNDRREKAICRDFLRSGHCKRGKKCKWRHALPERGQKKAAEEAMPSRSVRKSLHQRLVEQELEKEKEDKKKLEQQKKKNEMSTGNATHVTIDPAVASA
ncbi:MAG: hypothetical protein Q9220_003249 [cf. Caloplaca sp. 1 TL-2023]